MFSTSVFSSSKYHFCKPIFCKSFNFAKFDTTGLKAQNKYILVLFPKKNADLVKVNNQMDDLCQILGVRNI